MNSNSAQPESNRVKRALRLSSHAYMNMLPIIMGVILLTGLITEFIPLNKVASLFGNSTFLDAFTGALIGVFR